MIEDGIGYVDAFNRHAQLARIGKASGSDGVNMLVDVRIRRDDHRVLAAQFCGISNEALAYSGTQNLAGLGGTGKHQVIAAFGDGGADNSAGAGDDLQQILRQSCFLQEVEGNQVRKWGGSVGLGHNAIAGK